MIITESVHRDCLAFFLGTWNHLPPHSLSLSLATARLFLEEMVKSFSSCSPTILHFFWIFIHVEFHIVSQRNTSPYDSSKTVLPLSSTLASPNCLITQFARLWRARYEWVWYPSSSAATTVVCGLILPIFLLSAPFKFICTHPVIDF